MGTVEVGSKLTLSKGRLNDFLRSLDALLAAPIRLEHGEVHFAVNPPLEQILRDAEYVNSTISPVALLFPQTEVLFNFRLNGKPQLEFPPPPQPLIIFGIRSCDVAAMRYLEMFFSRSFVDTPFFERAKVTTLISIACQRPGKNCFCPCCAGGPFLEDGYDIQLVDFGELFLVEVGSEKGKQLLSGREGFFELASEELVERRNRLYEETLQKFEIASHMGTGVRKLTSRSVSEELWKMMASRCIECGGCAFVCPLCTCFDVVDHKLPSENDGAVCGWRERCWDCCQFAGYSMEAAGVSPRPDKLSRFKRRFYHKLSYFYMEMDGRVGCVGCGRCIQVCFGVVDMPAVVNTLREEKVFGVRLR